MSLVRVGRKEGEEVRVTEGGGGWGRNRGEGVSFSSRAAATLYLHEYNWIYKGGRVKQILYIQIDEEMTSDLI